MRSAIRYTLYAIPLFFLLSGCVVRTYPLTRDRVDQDISGNRGYLKGSAPVDEAKDKKTTRTTQMIEIELRSPLKFEKGQKGGIQRTAPVAEPAPTYMPREANRGFINQGASLETKENFERYTVQKNDTLQKISQKFYGTTKKWMKIYEANKDTLKSPDKVYPGLTLNIPLSSGRAQEIKENLK